MDTKACSSRSVRPSRGEALPYGRRPRYSLVRTQVLPAPQDHVFEFFGDASNLEAITPPWLHFRILSPAPIPMTSGTRIDYRLRLHGVPIRWTSGIAAWQPPHRFIDQQISGPYRVWIHEHLFRPVSGGTEVADQIGYDHTGGRLLNKWLVAPDLKRIFEYRRLKLAELFPG